MRPPARGDDPSLLEESTALLRTLRTMVGEVPGLVSDRVVLLALELRLARQAVVLVAGLFAAAALLMLTGWLAFWTGLVVLATDLGMDPRWAVGGAAVLNFFGAGLALWWALSLVPRLALPATMRHLTLNREASSATPPTPAARTSR